MNRELLQELRELKEESSVQLKAKKLNDLADRFDGEGVEVVREYFDANISSLRVIEEDIFSEATQGNLQSIKNKLEGISDLSFGWYKDMNGNYEDLDSNTLDDIIEDSLRELED